MFDLDESQIGEEMKHNFLTPKQAGQQELFNNMYGELGRKLADNIEIQKIVVEHFGLDKDKQDKVMNIINGAGATGGEAPPGGGPPNA